MPQKNGGELPPLPEFCYILHTYIHTYQEKYQLFLQPIGATFLDIYNGMVQKDMYRVAHKDPAALS